MTLFWIVVVGVLGYFGLKAYLRGTSSSTSRSEVSNKGSRAEIPGWLQERWELAQREGIGDVFPSWYFDHMTERQARRLEEDGRKYSGQLTKGQASDLIGLGEQPNEEDREVLRFFKSPLRGMNETRARHEIALLFREEANRKAWEDRPATARQREFFRFFGQKPKSGLLKREADHQIQECLDVAEENNDPRAEQWIIYDSILEDFDDPDFRETYSIRKPSTPAIRKAIDALLALGRSWDDLDSDSVADYLVESNPDLER